MKKVEQIINTTNCYGCLGKGEVINVHEKLEKCELCKGTGKYHETHYFFIDEKNGIALDADTLK